MRRMLPILIIAAAGTLVPAISLWAADQRGSTRSFSPSCDAVKPSRP
jgi:hypothetical protein